MDPPRHEKVFLGLIFKDQVVPKVCLFFYFFFISSIPAVLGSGVCPWYYERFVFLGPSCSLVSVFRTKLFELSFV